MFLSSAFKYTEMEAATTFNILWNLHEKDSKPHELKTQFRDFFEDKVVIWSLGKYLGINLDDASPKNMAKLKFYFEKQSKCAPSEVISKHTYNVHHRLVEYILSRNKDSYDKLLLEEGKNINKLVHACIAIYFGKWEYIPDCTEIIRKPENVKLIIRMFARFSNPTAELSRIFGIPQTVLKPFSYAKCICFAAGAYSNKALCNDLAKEYPNHIGYISDGARRFQHEKLADRYGRSLTPSLPSQRVTHVSVTFPVFWYMYVGLCSIVVLFALIKF